MPSHQERVRRNYPKGITAKSCQQMNDAAEMLWVVLANVSGGDWTKQSEEWQEAAARWRDNYFAVVSKGLPVVPTTERTHAVESIGIICRECALLPPLHAYGCSRRG